MKWRSICLIVVLIAMSAGIGGIVGSMQKRSDAKLSLTSGFAVAYGFAEELTRNQPDTLAALRRCVLPDAMVGSIRSAADEHDELLRTARPGNPEVVSSRGAIERLVQEAVAICKEQLG